MAPRAPSGTALPSPAPPERAPAQPDAASPPHSSGRARVAFVVIASAAFATSGPLARWARPVSPLVVAFGRVALAGVLLAAVDAKRVLASVRALPGRVRARVFGAGALLAAHFALFLWGLDRTSLPAAVSLVSLEPLSVLLAAWAIHGLRPTRLEQLGVLTATAGAAIVARGAGTGDHRLFGDVLVLGAVVLYGLYVSAARGLKDALPARPYAALVYLAAAIALFPCLAFLPRADLATLPPHGLLAIVLLALVPTILGHTMVQTAARELPPSLVALVSPGETLGAVAIGAVALGAVPSRVEIEGALVILAGATLALLGGERRAR